MILSSGKRLPVCRQQTRLMARRLHSAVVRCGFRPVGLVSREMTSSNPVIVDSDSAVPRDRAGCRQDWNKQERGFLASGGHLRAMKKARIVFLIVFVIALLAVMPVGQAQTTRGRVVGIVTDASKAIIVNASVTLVNAGTNIKTVRQTSGTGLYVFDNLDPGTYSVTVEMAGFNKFVQENILVQTGAEVTVDAALSTGSVQTSVTINEAPAAEMCIRDSFSPVFSSLPQAKLMRVLLISPNSPGTPERLDSLPMPCCTAFEKMLVVLASCLLYTSLSRRRPWRVRASFELRTKP